MHALFKRSSEVQIQIQGRILLENMTFLEREWVVILFPDWPPVIQTQSSDFRDKTLTSFLATGA